ncbi:MAG: DEAD/DEAH box helicase [Gemmatimonadales bacterium]|nr:DEAD/DEAH box helicase [Gemmatimonadales bacterium]
MPAREARLQTGHDLGLNERAVRWMDRQAPKGIYTHQHRALSQLLAGKDVCISTATASGKSLVFQLAALHAIAGSETAKVLAFYPQKALGYQQEQRWRSAMSEAGFGPDQVALIDGDKLTAERPALLERARVVVMTPDVAHAWLMRTLGDSAQRRLLEECRLLVVDEVHALTGVFGSNAAFFFRRLRAAMMALGGRHQVVAASATIARPEQHTELLLGVSPHLITPTDDGSPRHQLRLCLAQPPSESEPLASCSQLLAHLVRETTARFLCFADSRKLVEQLAAMSNRLLDDSRVVQTDDDTGMSRPDLAERASILPYRAGYEREDAARIRRRLEDGSLRGIVSTSALELGIDLAHLDVGVLYGVPRNATSLWQRLGRIGRARDGDVIVLKASTALADEAAFAAPQDMLSRPPAEGALHLGNRRIQCIHAMCLAGVDGEAASLGIPVEALLAQPVKWPAGFQQTCALEATGQASEDMRYMRDNCQGNPPHWAFPLRDVETQFRILQPRLGGAENRGSLSFGQLLREAYPGAVYFYMGEPFRVRSIYFRSREVIVKNRGFSLGTRPIIRPPQIFPGFQSGGLIEMFCHGTLTVARSALQVRQTVTGWEERVGTKVERYSYPQQTKEVDWKFDKLQRNYFTTGTLLFLPTMDQSKEWGEQTAQVLLEALLYEVPFDRQDIEVAVDRLWVDHMHLKKEMRFLAVYDQTYGSLELASRLADTECLQLVLRRAVALAKQAATVQHALFSAMLEASMHAREVIDVRTGTLLLDDQHVICPGSHGLYLPDGNVPMLVKRVFFHPQLQLAYAGSIAGWKESEISCRVSDVRPIPGESRLGKYNFNTGEVEGCE